MKQKPDLLKSESLFRQISETALTGVYIVENDLFVYVNPSAAKIFGYSIAELIGQPLLAIVAPQDRPMVAERLRQRLNGNFNNAHYQFRGLRKNGEERQIEVLGGRLEYAGKVGVMGHILDITEQKLAEERILRLNRLYATVSRIRQVIVHARDEMALFNGICQAATEGGMFQMAWIGVEDLPDQMIIPLTFSGFEEGYLKDLRIAFNTSAISLGPTGTAARDGVCNICQDIASDPRMEPWRARALVRGYLSSAAVPFSKHGKIAGTFTVYATRPHAFLEEDVQLLDGIGQDITYALDSLEAEGERQKAEMLIQAYAADLEERVEERTAALSQLNQELARANRAKDEFLAIMSHELRTPLNSILGPAELIQLGISGPITAEQSKWLDVIRSNGQHLLAMIDDILDLSKAITGKLEIAPEMVDIGQICQESLRRVEPLAREKEINLAYQTMVIGSELNADPRRLKQILINLLDNAVKFTLPHGSVTLQVQMDRERDQIQFSVTDTGIGIEADKLQFLFKPFSQLDSALNRRYEGTGLGLALVNHLARLHRGSIQVESEPGKGSKFTLWLPLHNELPPAANYLDSSEVDNGSAAAETIDGPLHDLPVILVVDDNEASLMGMRDYLAYNKYNVLSASSGRQALAAASQHTPDLALVDVQMPEMDGLELIQRLRGSEQFAHLPIIAVTALAMQGDRERCLAAGATDYISKPFTLKDLRRLVEDHLETKN